MEFREEDVDGIIVFDSRRDNDGEGISADKLLEMIDGINKEALT